MKLSSKFVILTVLTSFVWLLISSLYGYQWVVRCMADVTCRDYEGIWILPALGFVEYDGPKLVLILAGILFMEWFVFFSLQRRKRASQA